MQNKIPEWTEFFAKVFREVKRIVYRQYKLEKDGSGPPEVLALREIVTKFPCPVRIVEIKIDVEKHDHIKDEICQIVRCDFSKLGIAPKTVHYYGIVDAKDSERLKEILTSNFDLNDNMFEGFYRDFKTVGWFDDEMNSYAQFPLYNIKENFERFVFDFFSTPFSFFTEKIRRKFSKRIDWNSEFNLKPDPISSISELTKMDETLSAFQPFASGAGIGKLQEDICNIQLIPSVPEDVKTVFSHAKDLHIYGFFHFNFFAIAQQYAYLALESAIKNRYYQSFEGKEVSLKNEKDEVIKIGRVDHQRIIDLYRRKGKSWNPHRLKINDEKFAFTTHELLDWLVRKRIITLWERRLCAKGIRLRNLMSHLTRAYVFPPGYSVEALEFVADLINKIYCAVVPSKEVDSTPVFPVDLSPSRTW